MFIESMKVFIDMFNKDTIKIFKDILEKFESRSSAVEETDCDKMIHEFAIQNATGTEKPKLAKFESCDGISINKFRKNKGIFKKFISKRRDRKGKKSEELCAGEDNNDRHEGETTEKHQVNIDSEGYTIKPKLTSDSDSNEESYTDTSFEESAKNLKFFIRPIKQDECEVEAEEKNEIITAFLKIPLIIPSQRSLFKNVNNEVAVSLNCLNDNKSTEIEKTLSTSNIQDEPNLFNTLKFDFDSVKKQKQNKFETEFEKKFENIPLIDDDNVDNTMLGIYENNETLAQTKYLDEKPKSIPIKMSASCNLSQKSNNNASHSE